MTSFKGFQKDGVAFFRGLAMAQNRDWFQAHRAEFEALWLEPMKTFLAEVKAPLAKVFKRPVGEVKVFRINRDVRFSKDKSPYKTHLAGMVPFAGGKAMESPAALYLHLGMEDLVAFGFYLLEPPQLKRLRAAVLDEKKGKELARRVAAAEKAGLELDSMEKLKRAPPGVDPNHPRIELLRQKGLGLLGREIPARVRYGAGFLEWTLAQARAAAPVIAWGFENL
jgi:uncharacterized protein (TIGR02453 family)